MLNGSQLRTSSQQEPLSEVEEATGLRPLKRMSVLDRLEAESIHILREVAGTAHNPVVLFSGGKDSVCVLRLVEKAFPRCKFPFPLLHVDTGHNFQEVIAFRDRRAAQLGARLHVASVQEALDLGRIEDSLPNGSRNQLQIPVLVQALEQGGFDAALGGARRDEEKARAKERVFSVRDKEGRWNPKTQRPEPWNLYNGLRTESQRLRVFPLSNWTELDVWEYIARESLELPTIYFAHTRQVVWRNQQWLSVNEFMPLEPDEVPVNRSVRVRTVGDMPCTGMIESNAQDLAAIVREVQTAVTSERGARVDDRVSEAAMEDRKKRGYF